MLGLNRNTLRKKIRELDIQVSRGAMMTALRRRDCEPALMARIPAERAAPTWRRLCGAGCGASTSSAGWRWC